MIIRGSGLGRHFVIDTDDVAIGDFLSQALRHLTPGEQWSADAATPMRLRWSGGEELQLCVGGRETFTGAPTPALARVMNVINIGATRAAGVDPVLHCGVLAHDGRAVLLPGRPGAGKSTTSTALLLRGLGYLSDEAAPVRTDLRVRPYPKPVVIGRGSWPSVPGAEAGVIPLAGHEMDAWWMDPTGWGSEVVTEPLVVGAVLAPQYRAGAELHVEELSRAEATAVLASNTFNMEDHGINGIERVAALTASIPLLRLTFGDVDELCDHVCAEVLS